MPMNTCPICSHPASHSFDSTYFQISQCGNPECGHLFATNSIPFAGVHNFADDQQVDYSIYQDRNTAFISYMMKRKWLKDGISLLDFGAGTGHILTSIRQRVQRLRIGAIEYNMDYHPALKKVADFVFRTIDEMPADLMFDFVIMIEVLEHLDDPIAVLTKIRRSLRKGGKILIATPAGELRNKTGNKAKMDAYSSPHHIQFFTEKSFKQCLHKSGFPKVGYRYINSLYPNRPYTGLKAMEYSVRGYLDHLKGFTHHLTYIAQ